MAKESGKSLGRKLPVSRAQVINRLWEFAQLPPGKTNNTIYGQIKAAEVLASIFDIRINRSADAQRLVEGKTSEEIDFFVQHGYFPGAAKENHQDNAKPREP